MGGNTKGESAAVEPFSLRRVILTKVEMAGQLGFALLAVWWFDCCILFFAISRCCHTTPKSKTVAHVEEFATRSYIHLIGMEGLSDDDYHKSEFVVGEYHNNSLTKVKTQSKNEVRLKLGVDITCGYLILVAM